MFALIFLFLYEIPVLGYIGAAMMYLALLFTILSGIEYFWKNRKVILESI
jgi:CDP-diacylglycerol--glycerol-3-phosphate 3-phosphatidyltransferase